MITHKNEIGIDVKDLKDIWDKQKGILSIYRNKNDFT